MAKKKPAKGKNKFIRLEDENLKFVVTQAKLEARSQNWVINACLTRERDRINGSNRK